MSKQVQKSNVSPAVQSELLVSLVKQIQKNYNKDHATEMNDMLVQLEVGKCYHDERDNIVIFDGIRKDGTYYRLLFRTWNVLKNEWYDQEDESYEYVKRIEFPALTKHPMELVTEASGAMQSGDIEKYRIDADDSNEMRDNTQLLHFGSKDSLTIIQKDLEVKKNHALAIQRTMAAIIEAKKEQLERVKDNMYGIIKVFEKKIAKIQKAIITIELYLGINEEIKQLQAGSPAAPDYPVCIRQGLLYMDEEIGDPMDDGQGLEFKDISEFDKWVICKGNYKKMFPEEKGMVALQIRRETKERSYLNSNPYIKAMMEAQDQFTYLFIRNGDNLYRLITDKIEFRPRLFPKRDELQQLFEVWQYMDKKEKGEGGDHVWHEEEQELRKKYPDVRLKDNVEKNKDMAENSVFFYKMRFALFQGILERTQIFQPSKEPIQLFAKDGMDAVSRGLVRLIYDDELTLPSGRLGFWDWIKSINSKITYGSRIVLASSYGLRQADTKGSGERLDDRFREGRYSRVTDPKEGLYYVQKGAKYVQEPVWIENPKYNPSLVTTDDEDSYSPTEDLDEMPDDKTKYYPSTSELTVNGKKMTGLHHSKHIASNQWLSLDDQIKYYGKIVEKWEDHPWNTRNGVKGTTCHGVVKNPKRIHKKNNNRLGWSDRFEYQKVKQDFMCIKYNPKDLIEREGWTWKVDPEERKNNISWKIYPNDTFIFNYDLVTVMDIEFYINSRVDRRHYIYMMPILWTVRKMLLQEANEEQDFKKLVKGELLKKGIAVTDAQVFMACEEWKKNLNWKRAISHDDQKALRMIIRKLSK